MREGALEGDPAGLPVLQSDLFGPRFRHGFTTRRGGVSEAPFDALNLGEKWGDRSSAVAENRRRLRQALGVAEIHFANQVHGADVVGVASRDAAADTARRRADAVWAPKSGPAVGVYVADCVPILVADLATGACAAVHAGWRGTVAKVLTAALAAMLGEPGARAEDLRVALGPSIGPCCFEVGDEVVAAVDAAYPAARAAGAVIPRVGRPHVDLWRLNALAAREAGLDDAQIDMFELCTFCDPSRFYSYRRDGGRSGQSAAVIQAAGPFLSTDW